MQRRTIAKAVGVSHEQVARDLGKRGTKGAKNGTKGVAKVNATPKQADTDKT